VIASLKGSRHLINAHVAKISSTVKYVNVVLFFYYYFLKIVVIVKKYSINTYVENNKKPTPYQNPI